MTKYRGSGVIATEDYHAIKWVGMTKKGSPITIELPCAINMGDVDLSFAEKGDTIATVTFSGVYDNTDTESQSTTEPWTIECDGELKGASSIMLGAGVFYVDEQKIGLNRGGGQFVTGRVFREINVDGDRGAVKDRIVIDEARPTIKLNTLEIIGKLTELYPAFEEVIDTDETNADETNTDESNL